LQASDAGAVPRPRQSRPQSPPRWPLILVEQADLARVGNHATHSRRVAQLTGVGSVAEAAALAAAGPKARLLVPRIVVGDVTCALAETQTGEPPT
jgi:cobalt-precorrin 5A hydrolase